ncbi:MAG: PEP-CTERM/exosortase system-associated acyltransferase [Sedimentisphaerales bacterium]|nr:PEP-CTERM/exosortase system-associated acyltransferase [Sedimentisphaerales bacterium]
MFDDYFEIFLADTPEGKEEHYKIRYQVYCEEMGFEDKIKFPQKLEYDDVDKYSIHFIVRNKITKRWVAAMRLIPGQGKKLPIESLYSINDEIDLFSTVELSRLCVVKDVRRRSTDFDPPHGITHEKGDDQNESNVKSIHGQRRLNRCIIWGLFRAATIYSAENNIENWVSVTTKALAKVISSEGFNLTQIGDACNHKGIRYPYKANVKEILSNPIWMNYQAGFDLYSNLEKATQIMSAA